MYQQITSVLLLLGILSVALPVQAQFLDFSTTADISRGSMEATCNDKANQVTLIWDPAPEAEVYDLRIDDASDLFDESCQLADGEDKCITTSDNSLLIDVTTDKTYNWWIYPVTKGVQGDRIDGPQFKCTLGIVPTTVPTSIPLPTTDLTLTSQRPTATPIPQPQCTRKPEGDANCNNEIDLLDFAIWRQEYLSQAIPTPNSFQADFNTDTEVTILDFAIWRQGYLAN